MRRRRKLILILAVMAAIAVITGSAWRFLGRKTVLIGFAGQLTGKQAELGLQERNGVQMAIDACNAEGGIRGRPVTLLVRDDLGMPQQAKNVDRELIARGVVAIIGHPTTSQTLAAREVTNPAHMVLISPTVSSPQVNGRDDFFFRVYPSFDSSARAFARFMFQETGTKRLGIILDTDNGGYSENYVEAIQAEFSAQQGAVVDMVRFSSRTQPDFTPWIREMSARRLDGLLIVASDIDTALIAQRVRILGWSVPLFASAWSQTATLLQKGGQAIEGLRLEQSFRSDDRSPRFLAFSNQYRSRYGDEPSFGAAFGFEAAQVLIEALQRTGGKADGLKPSLLKTRNFQGLMDSFSMDPHGDVIRPFYLSEVRNHRFVFLKQLTVSSATP